MDVILHVSHSYSNKNEEKIMLQFLVSALNKMCLFLSFLNSFILINNLNQEQKDEEHHTNFKKCMQLVTENDLKPGDLFVS